MKRPRHRNGGALAGGCLAAWLPGCLTVGRRNGRPSSLSRGANPRRDNQVISPDYQV